MNAAHERYRRYLETLTPKTLDALSDHVSDDVHFKDPFNDVRSADAMHQIFSHMFENVADITFDIRHMASAGDTCLMEWRFEGMLGGKPWAFEGMSRVEFGPDGRVVEHIDHWDAARDFYERLPVIGGLLRQIRRRLATR